MKLQRTNKQRIIMNLVLRAADEGKLLTVSDLHAALPYVCDYGSLRTSLRFLVRHGIVILEPAGSFKVVRPTPAAYAWFRTGAS